MGKKRRGHPDVEEILGRAWCYYCERDFEDLKLLISHQKAKHFKCDRCGRRLNTAGGLSVHMNQVHKENLTQVENALPNRQGLEVEIFGMEGIPHEILEQHRNRIIQNYYQAQEDRRIATGNPLPGQAMKNSRKKIKTETGEELKKRLAEFRAARKAGVANGTQDSAASASAASAAAAAAAPATSESPAQANPPFQQPAPGYDQQAGQPGFSYAAPASSLPARPTGAGAAAPPSSSGLPARPTQPGSGDDIDQLIRMAEAGIKPGEDAGGDKKGKKDKDKKSRMVYDDAEVSPEERMAALPRYVFAPEAAAA